jgi:hypothetical protein
LFYPGSRHFFSHKYGTSSGKLTTHIQIRRLALARTRLCEIVDSTVTLVSRLDDNVPFSPR